MNSNLSQTEVAVKDLMRGSKNVILLHDDKRYALTITRRGKLILTADNAVPEAKLSFNNAI